MSTTFANNIEKTQLVNLAFYPIEPSTDGQGPVCKVHNSVCDHNLISYNSCTDLRAWSNDLEQRRQHFLDVVCGRVST